jgi:hypothetical protein
MVNNSSVQLGKYTFLNIPLALLSRTRSQVASGSDIQNPSTAGSLNRTYKSEASRFEASVLQMAPSDTDSTSSWIAFGKKIPRSEIGPFLPYSLLDTVVWLAHVTSAGGRPMVL